LQVVIAVAEVPLAAVGLGRAGFEEGYSVEFGSEAAGQKAVGFEAGREVVGCEEVDFEADLEKNLEAVKLVWKAAARLAVVARLAEVLSARVASVHMANYTYCCQLIVEL
jgi:hypothetical protein